VTRDGEALADVSGAGIVVATQDDRDLAFEHAAQRVVRFVPSPILTRGPSSAYG